MGGQSATPPADFRPHLAPATSIRSNATVPTSIETNKIDALGEFIRLDKNFYIDNSSWTELFHARKGRSNFSKYLRTLKHRAAPFLHRYATKGVPVLLHTKPWTLQQKDAAFQRGNHPSAHAFTEFLRDEMGEMREKGMFIVLPYSLLRDLPQLRISPLGCVPQRERRPRMINDYTFSGVNPQTVKRAPPESMQWGKALHRLLWYVFMADQRHGPVLLSKTDLSDGFYQLHLTPTGALKLAVPFPHAANEPPLVAVPTRLPMGWTESPPAFSAATETAADIINAELEASNDMPPPHPLEGLASSQVPLTPSPPDLFPIHEAGPIRPPLAYVDVFVDDFIKAVQGWFNCIRVRRTTFHSIDLIFRPNDEHDDGRKQPISEKKLQKGDDFWSTQKIILGWLIDTSSKTISLPPHRQVRILELLRSVVKRKRTSVKEWQKLLGELRSMALAIPGSQGCFSFLQHALRPGAARIIITKEVRDQLLDFLWISEDVCNRPTHLAEVVPTPPSYFGAMDAAKAGMGGVWFPPGPAVPLSIHPHKKNSLQDPCLWRAPFPKFIQDAIVSSSNPDGDVTNSDLELCGTVAHDDILASEVPVSHLTTCNLSDNTPAVAWRTKGSTTTTGPAAYLLQLSSLHQRHYRYKPELHHIPGKINTMADDCSRLWHLTDSQLIAYFNVKYPQPKSWKMLHLRSEMHSALISCLLKKRSPPESYLHEIVEPKKHGTSGVRFAPQSMQTPMFRQWPILSHSSKHSDFDGEMAESRPAATRTELAQWRRPFGLSARNFPAWGPKIPG